MSNRYKELFCEYASSQKREEELLVKIDGLSSILEEITSILLKHNLLPEFFSDEDIVKSIEKLLKTE